MNKLACSFSRPSYSLVVRIINFCIVEPFNFTLYTKRTYMCDTCGLITANSTYPFGTSWSQLYMCSTVDHVSSNGGQTAAVDSDLLMYNGFRVSSPDCPLHTAITHVIIVLELRRLT